MGSSGGGGTTTQVQKADPWSGQQPYLQDIFSQAQQKYYGGQPQYYPGTTVAPQTEATTAAQGYLTGTAAPTLQGLGQTAANTSNFLATGAPYVSQNPYLQDAIGAGIRPIVRNFQESILPSIRADFGQGENYGSSRRALATGVAAGRTSEAVGDVASQMASRGYETGLDAQVKSLALQPQVAGAVNAPAVALDAAGQQQQAQMQDEINAMIEKWNYEQTAPWASLTQYQNLVQGNYGGTTTSTSPTPTRNRTTSALGGALSGAAAGSAFGLPGAVIGGLAGLVLGGL